MTVLVDDRRRPGEFAVLKALGLTRCQVWAAVAWQTTRPQYGLRMIIRRGHRRPPATLTDAQG